MPHYETSLQRDIDRIRAKLSEMAELAAQSLEAAGRAFAERNRQLAFTVILRDRRIDELENEVDRLCLEFLVRQQPVAKHLRFAYSVIKVNLELERIGDYAESIARQAVKLSSVECAAPIESFERIADMSVPMLRDAVRSFLTDDVELARKTIGTEEEVDALRSAINAELYERSQDGRIPLKAFTSLMTIARRFERVSDQAKNICKETLYVATGQSDGRAGSETWRVIFVDRRHRCRSLLAEAAGNSLGHSRFIFSSAGIEPQSPDPGTLAFLKGRGIDLPATTPRSIEQIPNIEAAQVIVALSSEVKKTLAKPGKALMLDWVLDDPSMVTGTPEEKHAAYEQAYEFLHQHISDLCNAVLGASV